MQFSDGQKKELSLYLEEFLQLKSIENDGKKVTSSAFDDLRKEAIPDIKALVESFIAKRISLAEFKEQSDLYSRKYPYWGFKGFSGQMQLNQYLNNIKDNTKEDILRSALICPDTIGEAEDKITTLAEYLRKQKATAENYQSIPRVSQAFLLSYFWEMQRPQKWPVFYSSTKKVLSGLGVDLDNQEYAGDTYHFFADSIFSIQNFYEQEKLQKFDNPLWFVEHVLWAQFVQKPTKESTEVKGKNSVVAKNNVQETKPWSEEGKWIPPIISDIAELALNQETPWSISKGWKPEKAFETKLRYVFTLLGFEVEELGQGTGRQPDGVAISKGVLNGGDYAVIYDAKARENGYGVGTDDRAITEYIQRKQESLQREKRVRKLSFLIVSSSFATSDSTKEALKNISRATRIPVIQIEAANLLYIVEEKLKNTDIDHTRLEDLFLESGLLTREKIIEVIG